MSEPDLKTILQRLEWIWAGLGIAVVVSFAALSVYWFY